MGTPSPERRASLGRKVGERGRGGEGKKERWRNRGIRGGGKEGGEGKREKKGGKGKKKEKGGIEGGEETWKGRERRKEV